MAQTTNTTTVETPRAEPPFYDLVVAGASAGGIEALSHLVARLPADFSASVVIAQHLDPHRPSHLGEILGRQAILPIQTVTDGASQPLRPGVVYVVPPDRDVEITEDGSVELRTGGSGHSMPSVDRLLASAARAYGERLIAVILSGSGSDGTLGAREVKATGGMVVVENPETASYPSMPASLVPTTVDLAADLADLGALLSDLVSGRYAPTQPGDEALLAALLEQVYHQSGIDFAQYKRPTILRRLQRRMAATQTRTLEEYLQYLQRQPQEYTRLATSFLIKVTEFFRDPAVFAALRERVLPDVIAFARAHHRQVRIWSAGCATGEEAYSVAMLICEALGDELAQFDVRIFATDVDAQAIAIARRGVYAPADMAGVPSELRQRYFTTTDDGGQTVVPVARSLVIFGEHDLGQRAPFPNMDLVLCRNVLIYFTAELQKHSLQLFAYALRDGGYLVLGQAETVSPLAELFVPVEDQLKVYRRRGERILVPPARPREFMPTALAHRGAWAARLAGQQPVESPESPESGERPLASEPILPGHPALRMLMAETPEARSRASSARERLGGWMLDLPLGVMVLDRQYDIQVINAAACELLGIYRPAIGEDVLHLVERVPMAPLRSALDAAFRPAAYHAASAELPDYAPDETPDRPRDQTSVVLPTIQGEPYTVRLTLYPVAVPPRTSPPMGADEGAVAQPKSLASQQPPAVDAVLLLLTAGPPMASADVAALPTTSTTSQASPPPESGSPDVERTRDEELGHDEFGQLRAELAEAKHQRDRSLESMREVEAANRELMRVNLDLRQAHEEALLRQEAVQASEEEVRTLNEELQATNEELETLNEEMEATAEELRATNDDLMTRNEDLQRMTEERERKQVESEGARARLSAVLEQMVDPVLVIDGEGRPIISSHAYTKLFDGEAGDSGEPARLSRMLLDIGGRPLAADASPQALLRTGEQFQMAFLLIADDGTQRWFDAWGQAVHDAQGDRLGSILLIHEITDRTLLQLEERFLQLAVHELRTPVTVVKGYLVMLQRALSKPSAEINLASLRETTGHASHQVEQLRLLLADLFDLGRVESDKLRMRREPVELLALLRSTIEAVALAQESSREDGAGHAGHERETELAGGAVTAQPGIALDVGLGPETPIWIVADPLRVGQIFTNLLNNALTHAPQSERIEVRVRAAKGMAEVAVSDQGPGIPDGEVPNLFSPYRQVTGAAASQSAGLGLGLFIVKQLVQAHEGTIKVHTKIGHGTTFIVRLPLAKAPPTHIAGPEDDGHETQT